MSNKIKHLKITGRVQGVGFRYFTRQNARQLNITGWVKNMADGSVETVISGKEQNVSKMKDRLKKGPPSAKVDHITELDADVDKSYTEFSVKR